MELFDIFRRNRDSRNQLEQSRARLYRVAFSWCHNAALADDLVQETLLKAYRKSDQLRDPKAGQAWLFSILSNCYNDHFRRNRETEDIDNITLVDDTTPETETDQLQIVDKVRRSVATLAEGQRQVMTLVDLEGFSYNEVSNILDIPIGTVMSRLCRARNALKERLLTEFEKQPGLQEAILRRVK
ncbi:MAG: sigma-70 family RNA polymerase sigma factor [Acidiferrobacterales bacterium]|jgi:RNA polymerase sigma-70 factor (ECF subfamily)|nr:sigma-70 family RNA polymerase sigma factor [Acidiferrobacterales bacterium]